MTLKSCFIFDVEGVLCDNLDTVKPYPSALELLSRLKNAHRKIAFLSNVSRKSHRAVLNALRKGGFRLEEDELLTAGRAVARYIGLRKPDVRCFVSSEGGLYDDLLEAGITIVTEPPVEYVVMGANRGVSYAELNYAMRLILGGATLLCSGGSRRFRGIHMGDGGDYLGEGALAAALEFATEKNAVYIGKPHPQVFEETLRSAGVKVEEAVMIGDSLRSDILGAKALGITAIWVNNTHSDVPLDIPVHLKPDMAIRGLKSY